MRLRFPGGPSTLLAVAATLALTGLGQAADIAVSVNQAKILKLSRPADTIVIGNPAIADASVQDARTIVLTGKGFGQTNLVILDASGAPIVDQQVVVSRDEASTVRVYRRSNVQTLSCTPNCEQAYMAQADASAQAAGN